MSTSQCTGWWHQIGLGRQPMEQLWLRIEGTSIEGAGVDIIAPFTFSGKFRPDGSIEMIKQYERMHGVLYVGRYDGEGTLFGTWDINGYRGEWLIRFDRPVAGSTEIEEVLPLAH